MADNLQQLLDQTNPVELLRNSQIGSYIYPVVPADFTNWIKEQKAWRDTAVLYDQSHHMDNVFLKGSDAIKLISDTAINSVANFPVDKASASYAWAAIIHSMGPPPDILAGIGRRHGDGVSAAGTRARKRGRTS